MNNKEIYNTKKSGLWEANLFAFIIIFLYTCCRFILIPFAYKIPNHGLGGMLIYDILPQIFFVLSVICSICIILFIIKLAKANSYSDVKQIDEFKKANNIQGKIKIVDWSFIGITIMCIFPIGFELLVL